MKEEKNNSWKIVKQDTRNCDQYLLGFFNSEQHAKDSVPYIMNKYSNWITDAKQLVIKRVDPELIPNPVSTDYSHYCRSLMTAKEYKHVMDGAASAEISCDDLMCGCGGRDYYFLSRMIPLGWTVIDIGASYAAQSYFFRDHKRYIAVEPYNDYGNGFPPVYHFQAKGTERYETTAGEFINSVLPTLNIDMKKTFAICHWVPDWFNEKPMELTRQTFLNCYVIYPA